MAQTWAFVQSKSVSGSGAGVKTLAFTSAVTAGNLIVVGVTVFGTDTANAVTDSLGTVYTKAGVSAASGNNKAAIWYGRATSSGACTVTLTTDVAASFFGLAVHEYSGLSGSTPLAATTTNSGSGTAVDAGSVTVPEADCLVFAVWGQGTNFINSTAGAGFTARESQTNGSSNQACYTEDRDASANVNGTFTAAGSCVWVAVAASFHQASATVDDSAADGLAWAGAFTVPADTANADFADSLAWAWAETPRDDEAVQWAGAFVVFGTTASDQSFADTVTFSDAHAADPFLIDRLLWAEFEAGFGFTTPDSYDADDDAVNWSGTFAADTGLLGSGRYRR